ncbi:hypothetical protein [Paenimyroides ceti]
MDLLLNDFSFGLYLHEYLLLIIVFCVIPFIWSSFLLIKNTNTPGIGKLLWLVSFLIFPVAVPLFYLLNYYYHQKRSLKSV